MKYVIASKCSQNKFISEKYKTVQPFKLQFFQNSLLVQLYTSANAVKVFETFLEAILWKPFQLSIAFLMSVASQKCHPFIADFSRGNS